MQKLALPVQLLLAMHQPRLGQVADMGIVVQNALHDAGLLGALLGQQLLTAAARAQLLDQHSACTFKAHHLLPVLKLGCIEHLAAAVFDGFVVVNQHG